MSKSLCLGPVSVRVGCYKGAYVDLSVRDKKSRALLLIDLSWSPPRSMFDEVGSDWTFKLRRPRSWYLTIGYPDCPHWLRKRLDLTLFGLNLTVTTRAREPDICKMTSEEKIAVGMRKKQHLRTCR